MSDAKWVDPRSGVEWMYAIRGSWAGSAGHGAQFGKSEPTSIEFWTPDSGSNTVAYSHDAPFTELSSDEQQRLLDRAIAEADGG